MSEPMTTRERDQQMALERARLMLDTLKVFEHRPMIDEPYVSDDEIRNILRDGLGLPD